METESDLKPWQCELCTYMNEPTWLVCGMCLKEREASNDFPLDCFNFDADLAGLNAAPDYPDHLVQPVVAMVSAAATTSASTVSIPPIPAVTVVSTSTSAFTTIPTTSIAPTGYLNAGNIIHNEAATYSGATPAPFSPTSTLNVVSSIANNVAMKKYTPYAFVPVNNIATPVNGWTRNNRRLVRVTAPAITAPIKTENIPMHSNVPRLRVITPESNPSYFVSSSATKVTSTDRFVPNATNLNTPTNSFVPNATTFNPPSYSGGVRIPLPRRTETPLTFPTSNGDNVVNPITPFNTTAPNFNSFNAGAQLAQPNHLPNLTNFPVTPQNLPNCSGAAPKANNITQYNAGTEVLVSPTSTRPAPVFSSLPNTFQCRPVPQIPPVGRMISNLTVPNNTTADPPAITPVPNPPPFTDGLTFNGAARVTTAAFAAAFATDTAPGWKCAYCTFINDKLLRRCAVCDTEEPEKKEIEQPAQVLPPPPAPVPVPAPAPVAVINNNPNVANDNFKCPSCYILYAQTEGMLLQNCGHKFCKNCLREVVGYSEDLLLKCPYKHRGVFCNHFLTDQEIVSILNFFADNANVATAKPAQQNVAAGLPQQNIPGPSLQNALPGPSQKNDAAAELIDLCSDGEEAGDHFRNLPFNAERNPAQIIGNELNYQELLDLEKEVLIPNMENFDCTICMTEQNPGEGVVIRDCLHMFCRECLKQAIKCNTDAEMRCPFGDGTTRCESMLQDREIKALVDANDFEKHLSRSIKEAEGKIQNTFHCKTVDCAGWCEYEEEVTEFHCPVCSKVNCINCKAIHTDLNCQQYQLNVQLNSASNPEDAKTNKMLQNMLKKGTAMNCPKCAIILSKVTGCDWLCCSMCKTEICWVTRGPRWGPKGRGDTSGGCRCRFGAGHKPCHPKCGNCH